MVVTNSQTESTRAEMWIGGRRPMLYNAGGKAEEEPPLQLAMLVLSEV